MRTDVGVLRAELGMKPRSNVTIDNVKLLNHLVEVDIAA